MRGKTFRAMAVATGCLCPLTVAAEEGSFDLDDPAAAGSTQAAASLPVLVNGAGFAIGGQTGAKGRYGRYTGAPQDGAFGSTWFQLQQRATEKDGGTFHLEAEAEGLELGRNRVLPDASASFRLGEQGVWEGRVNYQGIPFHQATNYHTLFDSSGNLLNGLTARSLNITASNAAGSARVNQYLSAVDIGTRRDRIDGDLSYLDFPGWKLSTKMEHEHKQGTKINSLFFYNANVFASIPEPVDYDTNRLSATADYTRKHFQARLSYIFSNFVNNQASYRVVTPFNVTTIAGYQASELSLPPSNQEHRIKAQFGVSPLESTNIAVNLSYGLQLQSDAFTARLYERTPWIGDTSYDGMIQTRYGNIALTSRPWADWNFRAAYTIDQRDNSSDAYKQSAPYRADGTAAFNGSGGVQYNRPYSFLNQRTDLEAGYRVSRATKLTVNYAYTDRRRDYTVTNRNRENTVGGRINTTLAPGLTGSVGYAHSNRQATDYDGDAGWAALGRVLTGNNSEADLRMYNYAARKRDEIKSNITWMASRDLSLGFNGRMINDQFPDTFFGVTGNRAASAGPDITYSPAQGVMTHFYYTYQKNFSDVTIAYPQNNASVDWRLNNRDAVHTVGVHGDWQVNDRLKLILDNTLSYGNTAFDEASWVVSTGTLNSVTTATSLPDNKSIANSFRLTAEYAVNDNLTFGLTGMWDRFYNKDYLNAQEASSAANQTGTAVIGAEGNGGYSVGVVVATARMTW